MEDTSDEFIAKRSIQEPEHFRVLVERYQHPIFSFLAYFIYNDQQAQDLAQEVFIKTFKALATFKEEKKFKTWIYQIARNTAIDYLRKQKKEKKISLEQSGLEGVLKSKEKTPHEKTLQDDKKEGMIRLVNTLGDKYKEVIMLYYFQQLSIEEIHKIIMEPINTVKTRLSRGRKQLLSLFQEGSLS